MKSFFFFCLIIVHFSGITQKNFIELEYIITSTLIKENNIQGVVLDEKDIKTKITYDIFGRKVKSEEYEENKLISVSHFYYSKDRLDSIITKNNSNEWVHQTNYYYKNKKISKKKSKDSSNNEPPQGLSL